MYLKVLNSLLVLVQNFLRTWRIEPINSNFPSNISSHSFLEAVVVFSFWSNNCLNIWNCCIKKFIRFPPSTFKAFNIAVGFTLGTMKSLTSSANKPADSIFFTIPLLCCFPLSLSHKLFFVGVENNIFSVWTQSHLSRRSFKTRFVRGRTSQQREEKKTNPASLFDRNIWK